MPGKNGLDEVSKLLGQAMRLGIAASAPNAPKPRPSLAPDLHLDRDRLVATGSSSSKDSTLPRQQRYNLILDLVGSRIYVVDKQSGKPVDRYLTSPGTSKYPTKGDSFVIKRALVRPSWYPPNSPWAKGLKPVGPGLQNPLGILAMDLGAEGQYIHGTPDSERAGLGRPASHGCLRMSNENVLQLFQRYVGVGTEVKVIRDNESSAALAGEAKRAGIADHRITDGGELLSDAVAGRLPEPRA